MSREQMAMKAALNEFLDAKPAQRDAAFRKYVEAAEAAAKTFTPIH